jgi:2-succinyl-6-hydroxy-2,4-cyclohexadiene-1-carboxylate synthase
VSGRCRLIALHGFLGRASEWDEVAEWFPDSPIAAIDLWSVISSADVVDWPSAGRAIDRAVSKAVGAESGPAYLVAYSFGARLALASSRLGSPDSPVRGCCVVSCNPGLDEGDAAAREARREADERWAERLLEWREPDIWREWDAQPVFNGSRRLTARGGLPATRTVLAAAMRRFSLAGQPDFRPRLRGWRSPLLWVTGQYDTTFSALARGLFVSGVQAEFAVCDAAGHRVPWDNPSGFAELVRAWMAQGMEASR